MIGQRLEVTINRAIKRANELRHEYLTLENVFLSLLEDEQVNKVLSKCGADIPYLRDNLHSYLHKDEHFSILSDERIKELSQKHFVDEELRKLAANNGIKYQPELSVALQRVIQRAAMHVQSSGKNQIMGLNLLVALFQEEDSYGNKMLQAQGVTRLKILNEVAHDLDKSINSTENTDGDKSEGSETPGKSSEGVLESYAINLNNLAKSNQLDKVVGREDEIQRLQEILNRRRKNNPLVVGDAGVGKTALIEGFAYKIVHGEVTEKFKHCQVFSLDMASMLAGAKFRGDFEQRLKQVLKDVSNRQRQGQEIILFIDEIHTIMGAGATSSGSMDASNLLKPYLSSGKIRCIGSTTHEEYRKFVEKDAAFKRRFQKIAIDEPSFNETIQILKGMKENFEKFHQIKISNKAIKIAVELSTKYIHDRKQPDKAIDIVDEAGAMVNLKIFGPGNKKVRSLSTKDLERVVAKIAKVPEKTMNSTESEVLRSLARDLKLLIYGQDHAVDLLSDTILMARSGLGDETKPIGSFLFAGPTGVGKTELTKQLATLLGNSFIRFDMSEYMEKHSVSKLIGSPPGYVGFDQGGILTDQVNKSPYSVVLLDEIEKAHPDIYNILLQIMDHGALTDSQGRSTSFKNVILIMTTNAGAAEMDSGSIGIHKKLAENGHKRDKVIKNFFSPEFRNRLSAIIHFNRLEEKQIIQIVEKFINELSVKLSAKSIELDVTVHALQWFAQKGYDPKMGARPLDRLVRERLTKPISREILFGELEKNGGVIKVIVEKNDLKIIFE
jgi:ATP-dependent Clp protease ATP-binding subunit ClpA